MKFKFLKILFFTLPLIFISFKLVHASDGLDFPLGKPEGVGYSVTGLNYLDRYDYQGDGILEYHPGEDWNEARNGKDFGGDNNDLGDPVFSIADGVVKYSKLHSAGWGNLVLIEHNVGGVVFWSQYAHLRSLAGIREGMTVRRGEALGSVGSFPYGTNKNIHLHFEIRKTPREASDFVYNWQIAQVKDNYYHPSAFINAHRPPPPVPNPSLTGTNKNGINTLTWDKAGEGFERYEVYKSQTPEGTTNPAKREVIATIMDQNLTIFEDKKVSGGNIYYYRVAAFYNTGQVGSSNEVSIDVKRDIRQITSTSNNDRYPFVYDGKIFYQSIPQSGKPTDLPILYYYDIAEGASKSANITGCNFKYPNSPNGNANTIAFYGYINSTTREEICYLNLSTGNAVPVSVAPLPKEQLYPAVSESGLIFWEDYTNGNTNIDIYFLDTKGSGGSQPFVTAAKNQIHPKVWGNKVVWKDGRNYTSTVDYDFYIKEIGSTEETKIATNVGNSFYAFWDKYVVWDFKGKLFVYDLETKITTTIKDSGVGYYPTVRDGKIAYTLFEGSTSYLHVYDIGTAKDTKIDFDLNSSQPAPAIWENYVAFDIPTDKTKPWDFDIYLVQI